MKRAAWLFGAAAFAASPVAWAQMVDHVVKPGETCAAIAQRYYGDSRLVDPLHEANPGLGPPPHALAPGRVLKIPPKPAAKAAGPDAKLAFVRNRVEVQAGETKPGKAEDPLFRGNRVATREASAAGISFRDESQVRVEEQTLVIILGDVRGAASRLTASDATLVTGSLRARMSELSGRPPRVVDTPSARVEVTAGEAKVSVDDKKTTRLAVHAGQSNVAAQKKTVPVTAGFGSRVDDGKPPAPPKPLPPAPAWDGAPPVVVTRADATEEISLRYRLGAPFDGLAEWHVQVARDRDFTDVLVDAKAPRAVDTVALRSLGPGRFFVRVSALDSDAFEGPFSAAAATTVVRVATAAEGRRATRVTIEPSGVTCSVDGAPAQPIAGPLVLGSDSARTLRCGDADGAPGAPLSIPIGIWSPVVRAAGVDAAGAVMLRVTDGDGAPIDVAPVVVALDPGVSVGAAVRREQGIYAVGVSRPPGLAALRLRARVATGETSDVVVPIADAPAAPSLAPASPRRSVGLGVGWGFAAGGFAIGGPRLALDGSYRLGGGAESAVVGLRATLERSSSESFQGRATTAWTYGGGPFVGLQIVRGRFAPYAAGGLEIDGQSLSRGGRDTTAALLVAPVWAGLEVRLGPGALFAEVGYRASLKLAGDEFLSQRGATGSLGSRFLF